MEQSKGSFEEAFIRKNLKRIHVGDYYIEHTVYKIEKQNGSLFDIKTAQNSDYTYGEKIIKETALSASIFDHEKKVTKTNMITLFAGLSKNDIWSAVFYKRETDKNWQEKLVDDIKGMQKDAAVKYVKKNFESIGKAMRELKGQKISMVSDNNYYMVRDLNIYFDELEKSSSTVTAEEKSIRKLDVNSLHSLIFNGVKYMLK